MRLPALLGLPLLGCTAGAPGDRSPVGLGEIDAAPSVIASVS